MTSDTSILTAAAAMADGFELCKPELLDRQNAKWRQYPSDVIPAFVADMDFRVAPAIQRAICRSVEAYDYGYPMRDGGKADRTVAAAFAGRMKRLYDWEVDANRVQVLADLVQGTFTSIAAYSEPGDGIIVQVPNYPPFRDAIATMGRKLIPLTMRSTAEGYVFDLDEIEPSIDERTRVLILCNPQNPTGRAFGRAELDDVLSFARRHDLVVIADEIHSDLVYPDHRHIPFCSLPGAAERTVTLNSATKSFNIPGLRCAVMHFGTDELMQRFHKRVPQRMLGSVNSIGIDATVAAWTEAQPWLDDVLAHLAAMRDYLVLTLRKELPALRFHVPEATYLLWLDCTQLGLEGSAFDFFLEHARIGFSPGEGFHPEAEKFVRMNFATSRPILDEMLDRMITAARSNHR